MDIWRSSFAVSYRILKVRKPITHKRQSFLLKTINTHPAVPLMREQSSSFKKLEVPRRSLPGMAKHRRDLPGGHRASVEIDR
jgi:hypothetical protein